jgi:hypothetical protein
MVANHRQLLGHDREGAARILALANGSSSNVFNDGTSSSAHLVFRRKMHRIVAQHGAFDELHDEERASVCLADLVDRADVWIIESRRRSCLAKQAVAIVLIQVAGDHLDRNRPAKLGVIGAINDTIPPAPSTDSIRYRPRVVPITFVGAAPLDAFPAMGQQQSVAF